jgi:6-phosphogluconolactonase
MSVLPRVLVCADARALADRATTALLAAFDTAIAERGRCRWALSGGSTPKALYRRLAEPALAERVDWERIDVLWGDERAVPPDDERSNYRMAHGALLAHVPIVADNVHRIEAEKGPDAAEAYAAVVDEAPIDVLLLGMGGDGHTASLFPGGPELDELEASVVSTTSPAPPHQRISLTIPALNRARSVLVLVSGSGKADMLARVLDEIRSGAPRLPLARIAPRSGNLTWLIDEPAAARLKQDDDSGEETT